MKKIPESQQEYLDKDINDENLESIANKLVGWEEKPDLLDLEEKPDVHDIMSMNGPAAQR